VILSDDPVASAREISRLDADFDKLHPHLPETLMDLFLQLWLPVLATTFALWIASTLAWTVIGHHNRDTDPLPNEDQALDAIRSLNIPPGSYMFPQITHGQANAADCKAKWEKGPIGLLRVFRPINMPLNIICTVIFFLIMSTLLAYLGSAALARGATFAQVLQVMGTAGVLTYSFSSIPHDIWFQTKKRQTLTCAIDGIAFGLITGLIFAWLWPR